MLALLMIGFPLQWQRAWIEGDSKGRASHHFWLSPILVLFMRNSSANFLSLEVYNLREPYLDIKKSKETTKTGGRTLLTKAKVCGCSYSSFWKLVAALERLHKLARASILKDVQKFCVGQEPKKACSELKVSGPSCFLHWSPLRRQVNYVAMLVVT